MATKTTKKTTTARKTTASKAAPKKAAPAASKVASVLDAGVETDYKTKYHFMCIIVAIFAIICGVLFWAICVKQSDYEDLMNCYADDTNCTLPNKRAQSDEKADANVYYDGEVVVENAAEAAGQE